MGLTLGSALVVDLSPLVKTAVSGNAPCLALEPEADDRGSGRLYPQQLIGLEVGYRGSGRVSPSPQSPDGHALVASYRGSGRVSPSPQSPDGHALVASYHGSGRVNPQEPSRV